MLVNVGTDPAFNQSHRALLSVMAKALGLPMPAKILVSTAAFTSSTALVTTPTLPDEARSVYDWSGHHCSNGTNKLALVVMAYK